MASDQLAFSNLRQDAGRRNDASQILGSSLADSAVEPTRSQNITVSWRRSASSRRGDSVATGAEGCRYGNRSIAESADRPQHFATIAEQNPHFFQVLVCEVRKDAEVNAIFDETLGALGHAEFFEPIRNFLHRDHQGPIMAEFWPTANKERTLTGL